MIDRVTLHYAAMRIASLEYGAGRRRNLNLVRHIEEDAARSFELRRLLGVAEVPPSQVEREVRIAAFLLDAGRALWQLAPDPRCELCGCYRCECYADREDVDRERYERAKGWR